MTSTEIRQQEYRDYGYRAWTDVQPGDYVNLGERVGFYEVVSVEPIPVEETVTGSPDYVRVVVGTGDARWRLAFCGYHFTTVYYRTSPALDGVALACLAELARWEDEGGSVR
jgi:hypothetical protein